MSKQPSLAHIRKKNLERYKIVVWEDQGMNISEISRNLGLDRTEVYRVLERFQQHGSVETDLRHDNTGRPPILTKTDMGKVKKIFLQNDPMDLEAIKEEIRHEMDIEVSKPTLSRALRSIGSFLKPTWTPILTDKHKEARLDYCETHIERKTTFHNVIFTDESRFYVNRTTKKVFVVKGEPVPQKQKSNPDYSVMVWGAICYEGVLHLQVVEGSMNHMDYIDILQQFFQESVPTLTQTTRWRFLQDSAPPHKPIKVKEFIRDNGLSILEHPANSPDLNPIELIWAYMKAKVEGLKPKTQQELEDAIFDTWDEIPVELVQNCIDRLREYLPNVIEAAGGLPPRIT